MGNKISIRDKFEPFLAIQDPNQALAALKEILAQPIIDDDAREVMTPNVLRKYIQDNPAAFKATLIECINHVFYIAGTEKILTEAEATELNNTLLLLIRFLPILHEEDSKTLATELLWTKIAFPQERVGELKQGPYVMEECLAIKLMHSLFRLMFHPDYTVSSKKYPEPKKLIVGGLTADMRVFWKGFDNFRHENDNTKFYYNRTKVLECLLACFSTPLLHPLNVQDRTADPWIQYCVSPHNSLILPALISMMAFGLSYEENYTVPYTQYIISDVNGEKLALLSLQLFGLFCDVRIDDAALYHKVLERPEYQQIIEHYLKVKDQKLSVDSFEVKNTQTSKEILQNACLMYLSELRLTECYEFISRHVLRVLRNPYDVENTFLIESRKKTILLEEILLIFWRFIEYNRTYVQRAMYFGDFLQLIVHLIYQIHESFTYASKSSVFYIAIIILSKLSCDRTFSIQMKKKFMNDIGFTRIPIFIGSHIDLLFIVLLNGMVDSYVNGYFCYQNNLLAILHNVSPFAKDLSPITTSLLVQLVKATANPRVLKADKGNLLVLRKTLNLIHKILCYQPETCPNLLFELLSQGKELESLKTLPLKKIYGFKAGTANQSRIDQSKADQSRADQSVTKASDVVVSVKDEKQDASQKPEEEEESKGEPQPKTGEKVEHDIIQKNPSPVKAAAPVQIQMYDEKWMELFGNNVANDLIFLVIDYLQEQLRASYRERNSGVEEEVKGFLQEQSILGIVPQPGPIMVEVVNDPENINNNLFLFLWQQIFLKTNGSPHFEPRDAKLLGLR